MSSIIASTIEHFILRDRGSDTDGSIDILANIKEFSDACAFALERQMVEEKEQRKTLRLSSLGKCPRQQVFTVLGVEQEPLTSRTYMTFLFGDVVEAVVTSLAKMAGVNLHSEQTKVEFLGVKGHIDGIVEDYDGHRYLFECKSMSDMSFKMFQKNGITDDWGYLSQMNVYMEALGLDSAVLFAVNKNTGHYHEQIVSKSPEVLSHVAENHYLIETSAATGYTELPPGMFSPVYDNRLKMYKLPVQCAYCSYQKKCWEDTEGFTVETEFNKSGKPVFVLPDYEEG